jgi:serine/threonine-protein kinase
MLEHRTAPARPDSEAKPGDRVLVKLTDFGIAKLLDAQGVTSTGQVLGSPAHMAPEQIEGADVDGRADVFGLGVLLYECMVGHLPFEGKNPSQVLRRVLEGVYPSAEHEQPKIGKRWSAILDKALARLPEGRFADAISMKGALVAELKLLGVESPRTELEVWFDDPGAYAARRDPGLIGKLCDLGRAARARGSVLEAAAHFNRALAYAPHDPALLKIVAAMHRERRSRDFAKRLVPVVLVSAALGTGAFFVTRALKHRSPTPGGPVLGSVLPVARPSASPSPPAPAPSSSVAVVHPRVIAPPPIPHPPKPVERKVTIGATHPSFGLLLAIDGVPQGEAHEGLALTLDGRAHDLTFSCKENECVPLTKNLPAGDDAQISLPVHLNVKPASLVVDGNAALDYGLEEFPSIPVRVGVAVPIPIPYGNYAVHVVERTSGRRVTGTLKPGREVHVSFAQDPSSP